MTLSIALALILVILLGAALILFWFKRDLVPLLTIVAISLLILAALVILG